MPRSSDDPRDHTICFRTTKSEKDKVDQWIGSRNRSDVLRSLVLGKVAEAEAKREAAAKGNG